MTQRTDRVDELLRQEIGALLAKEVADPRIGFATITDVETAPDLRHAKVWVSVIGQKGDRDETIRALRAAMPFVQHELGKRLRIKRIPMLHVHLDDTAERGTRVLHLLDELAAGVAPEDVTTFKESLPTPVRRLPHDGDTGPDAAGENETPAADALDIPAPETPARRGRGGPFRGPRPSGGGGGRPVRRRQTRG